MLGHNFIHLLYGFPWNDLTWKEPYKNMEPERVLDEIEKISPAIEDKDGNKYSIMTLLYSPDTEDYFIGVEPGYTKESVAFDVFEQVVDYVINAIAPFVEENELTLGKWIDEYDVYTG